MQLGRRLEEGQREVERGQRALLDTGEGLAAAGPAGAAASAAGRGPHAPGGLASLLEGDPQAEAEARAGSGSSDGEDGWGIPGTGVVTHQSLILGVEGQLARLGMSIPDTSLFRGKVRRAVVLPST